jgi:SAM-dependent methyltransferase
VIEDLRRRLEERPAGVSDRFSPDDVLYDPDGVEHYMRSADIALRHIRLALLTAGLSAVDAALDFACGYGRVLRMLRAEYPHARIVACDVDRNAVDFCATAFEAEPVYSDPDPDRIAIEGPFELIWSGSFFTHIGAEDWERFLRLLTTLLSPGGVLVFTTAGRHVVELMRGGELARLSESSARALLENYERNGFGFAEYPGRSRYGLSRAAPAWVCDLITRIPGLRLVGYAEAPGAADTRQDFVSCVRLD